MRERVGIRRLVALEGVRKGRYPVLIVCDGEVYGQ
jgi:hypothetical protein